MAKPKNDRDSTRSLRSFWPGYPRDRLLSRLRRHSSDFVAGLTGGLASIPDGMATSLIIGVPPLHGLYASVLGPIIGGLTCRTALMLITTTSASSLAALEAIRGVPDDQRVEALLLVRLLAGIFQVAASLLGLARLTSFVSHSVMTGFLMGIATLIILGQLGTFAGYEPEGSGAIAKTSDLLRHVSSIDVTTLALGCLTVVLILGARRFGLSALGPFVGLAVPSLIVALSGIGGVAIVQDVSAIPSGLPTPAAPDFSLISVSLATGALAVAAIIFVQTAGVSQALPGGAGAAGVDSRDLTAAGLANVGVAFFKGQPVGGSFGQSAINVEAGAVSRLATIMTGLWVLVAIVLFAGIVERVVMTALAAILIVSAFGALDAREAVSIWRTNLTSRATILATFLATLFLPIQYAVALGVLLSAVLYLATAAMDVHLVELVEEPGGALSEHDPPTQLCSDSVTTLQVYGSLFYAGARTLARRLPEVNEAERAVVILRLRGMTRAGATAVNVLAAYAGALQERDGRLYIAGLDPALFDQLKRSGKLQLARVRLFPASSLHGGSVARSSRAARTWLARSKQ
jgi:SulP family sulfate permease